MTFPKAIYGCHGGRITASLQYILTSLQSQRAPREELSAVTQMRHAATVRLLGLLGNTESPLAVELNTVSWPSLDPQHPARVTIFLRFTASGVSRNAALERCLSHGMDLCRHLAVFWPEALFEPSDEGLPEPFPVFSALRILRRREIVSLDHPLQWRTRRPIGFPQSTGFQTAMPPTTTPSLRHTFEWVFSGQEGHCPIALEAQLSSNVPLWTTVRLAPFPACVRPLANLANQIRDCGAYLDYTPGSQLNAPVDLLKQSLVQRVCKLRESALRCAVILRAPGPCPRGIAMALADSFSGNYTRTSSSNPFIGGYRLAPIHPEQVAGAFAGFDAEPFSAEEAACAFRLPVVTTGRDCALPVRRSQLVPVPAFPSPGLAPQIALGVNRNRGQERSVRLPIDHLLKHVFLLGMTGTGKSTILLSLLVQLLRGGSGLCLIDPHGDLANDLLSWLPKEREKDLVVMDLAEDCYPLPFNLLHCESEQEMDVLVDELFSFLQRIYRDPQMFGPIFEMNFRAMLKLLIGGRVLPGFTPTLLDFAALYQNPRFRQRLLAASNDEQLKDFIEELERVRGENQIANLAPYVTNKLARFVQDRRMARMLGHGRMAIDFDGLMKSGGILIVKLARGEFPSSVGDLITSQLVARYRLAAQRRSRLAQSERRPYFLCVDEFGTMARDENFSMLLSEARKYGLGLMLATQYASQLRSRDGGEIDHLAAIMGNVGTVISMRVGAEDAQMLAPVFYPSVSPADLLESPNFEGYARLHLDRESVNAFSIACQPLKGSPDPTRARTLQAANRLQWGVSAIECDENASRRRDWIRQLNEAEL